MAKSMLAIVASLLSIIIAMASSSANRDIKFEISSRNEHPLIPQDSNTDDSNLYNFIHKLRSLNEKIIQPQVELYLLKRTSNENGSLKNKQKLIGQTETNNDMVCECKCNNNQQRESSTPVGIPHDDDSKYDDDPGRRTRPGFFNIPRLRCPTGQRRDYRGRCRQVIQ